MLELPLTAKLAPLLLAGWFAVTSPIMLLPEQSPWGTITHKEVVIDGVDIIDSNGNHGGWRIRKDIADKNLSDSAKNHATKKDDKYFWYEEDCDWFIPAKEMPQTWDKAFQYAPPDIKQNPEKFIDEMLGYTHKDYLQEVVK